MNAVVEKGLVGIFFIVSILLGALVLKLYWSWFLVPIFMIKAISFSQALCLSLFISYVQPTSPQDKDATFSGSVAEMFLTRIYYLILGFCFSYLI